MFTMQVCIETKSAAALQKSDAIHRAKHKQSLNQACHTHVSHIIWHFLIPLILSCFIPPKTRPVEDI